MQCHDYDLYSISYSPNGWTDQELGALWLERDFEPITAQRNRTDGYRLLILDGHNSHCTFQFCKFAEENWIIVVCLPSHTTHALQPCDVGIFGPLSSSWRAEVLDSSRKMIPISKQNLIRLYHNARERAFKPSTICNAFAKTGIWPLNPDAIDSSLFEPAQNTTTKSAQPMAAEIPVYLLAPIHSEPTLSNASHTALAASTPAATPTPSVAMGPSPSPSIATTPISPSPSALGSARELSPASLLPPPSTSLPDAVVRYRLVNVPAQLPQDATQDQLERQNAELWEWVWSAKAHLERNYAQMVLMDKENQRLRLRAFGQAKRKATRGSSHARHMTSSEMLDELAFEDFEKNLKAVFVEAAPLFKDLRGAIDQYHNEIIQRQKEELRRQKEEERERKRVEEAAEKERRKVQRKEEQAAKRAETEAKKRAEKDQKAEERARAKAARQAAAQTTKGRRKQVIATGASDEPAAESVVEDVAEVGELQHGDETDVVLVQNARRGGHDGTGGSVEPVRRNPRRVGAGRRRE